MAEERVEPRETNFRQLLPWTELFRGFQVALDPKKLLLAAAGILVMGVGWWLLGAIFDRNEPTQGLDFPVSEYTRRDPNLSEPDAKIKADNDFRAAHARWELVHQAARADGGTLRTWPWFEHRGPNPYLLVTGQTTTFEGDRHVPWEQGHFLDWFLTDQLPVLVEPLIKFFLPIRYLLDARGGFLDRIYFLLVTLFTLAVWALFGGAITRMAAVQLARNEKISMMEAIRFVAARYLSFLSAPLFPLLFIAVVTVFLVLFGVIHMIPVAGEIIDGLLWVLPLLGATAMAIVLVGLVGWPMMSATISAEGSDSFDAISRSYSYVYQSPWNYIWNCLVALAYGAVVVFFVGFMGSLVVYLAKWGVNAGSIEARDPSFLFVYAPESFGWRELLLQGATVNGKSVVANGVINAEAYREYLSTFRWWNWIGTWLVTIWIYVFFLMILGFAYSYFWSASTIIYLLMRRKVDDTDFDEVYLEEDETEEAYSPPKPVSGPPATASATAAAGGVTMVEPPSLRPAAPQPPTPAAVSPTPAATPVRTETTTAPSKDDGNGDQSSPAGSS